MDQQGTVQACFHRLFLASRNAISHPYVFLLCWHIVFLFVGCASCVLATVVSFSDLEGPFFLVLLKN
ncbi:hypothetical protein SORBI_3003G256550 [Sorghum bicolor]|uniref:Uncharacterized protein n=1 Tax=Sorghum bicolor TaxID=4558 RepID=A0A1W0VYW2_SORBI|nr:hypothetical protein SORBI_3003G256550 [Sorghum bicolor]